MVTLKRRSPLTDSGALPSDAAQMLVATAVVWAFAAADPHDCARPSHPGVCFNFDDVQPPAQALTSPACCARCRRTAGCAAWTWFGAAESQCQSHPTWCSCYLKKGTSHRTNSSTCTSGVIGAPPGPAPAPPTPTPRPAPPPPAPPPPAGPQPPPGNPTAHYRGCHGSYPGCASDMPDPRGSGDPGGVPLAFSCAYRAFAAEFAAHLRPDADPTLVFDALQLGTLCNKTRPARHAPAVWPAQVGPARAAAAAIYVAVDGDDSAAGTGGSPKRTIGAGLAATRALPAGQPKALRIGAGTYHLHETLTLTAADSHLTIEPAGTGAVWVSGAQPLPSLRWQRAPASGSANVWSAQLPASFTWPANGLSGRQLRVASAAGGGHEVLRAHRARHPNGDPERSFFQSWFWTNSVGNIATPRANETFWLPPNGCPGVDGTSNCRWPACAAYHRDDKNLTGCVLGLPTNLISDAVSCHNIAAI